ncbi:MAG: hypothetical protein WBI20_04985 [Burkholderiaceae bacterium]
MSVLRRDDEDALFDSYKQSGMGREEGFDELLTYTQHKNVHVVF